MDFKCEFYRNGYVNDTPTNQKAIIDCKVQRPCNKVVEVHIYNSGRINKLVSCFDMSIRKYSGVKNCVKKLKLVYEHPISYANQRHTIKVKIIIRLDLHYAYNG